MSRHWEDLGRLPEGGNFAVASRQADMVVGGEIPGRGNGAKAQSQETTGSGWESGCMCVGEPGKVGRGQVVGAWSMEYSLFWEKLGVGGRERDREREAEEWE